MSQYTIQGRTVTLPVVVRDASSFTVMYLVDGKAAQAIVPPELEVDEAAPGGYPTPVTHAAGRDPVFVGRIRADISHPNGLNLWIVADNIRKVAALNAIQISEILVKS